MAKNHIAKRTNDAHEMVSLIIPTLCQGEQADHLPMLRRLLTRYLPEQTYSNFEAIVCCEGPNEAVRDLVREAKDPRIRFHASDEVLGHSGHPQTRRGIKVAAGDYFVRMNDDNRPYPNYLEDLVGGFEPGDDVVYGRVIFGGQARRYHDYCFVPTSHLGVRNELNAFILPRDKAAVLRETNVDCMSYMVRMPLAQSAINYWTDDYAADWKFIASVVEDGACARFVDVVLGEKR